MSEIHIIGGGLAGLATAIKLVLHDQSAAVIIHEKKCRESNTQIAGMRIRLQKPEELIKLLGSRNEGIVTAQMRQFAELIPQEIEFWEHAHRNQLLIKRGVTIPPLRSVDKPEWFGPQWGEGKGKGCSTLNWFRELARQIGVQFDEGEVIHLDRFEDRIKAIQVKRSDGRLSHIEGDAFILAGGSVAGTLFHSTNKEIRMGSQRLAFDAGVPLAGGTINMWHPFGRSDCDGNTKLGCFETDTLDDVVVQYKDGQTDEATTAYLRSHTAHDNFPEICKRLIEHGYTVQLVHADGTRDFARLSHHYAHLGVQTYDGVTALGVGNLFAVGDASGWNSTGYRQRFPGLGIAKAIVDAERIRSTFARIKISHSVEGRHRVSENENDPVSASRVLTKKGPTLKDINTAYAMALEFGNENPEERQSLLSSWESELNTLHQAEPDVALSKELQNAYEGRYIHGMSEPISIVNPMSTPESVSMGMRR